MKSDSKVIGGFRYRMTQVGASTGNQIILRLSRPLSALFADAARKGTKLTKEDLLGSVDKALGALAPEDLDFIAAALAARTSVWLPDGTTAPKEHALTIVFEEHFAGRYGEELAWLRWGIELNRFFGDALEWLSQLGASKSDSPTESTGGTGVSSVAPSA